MDDSQRDLEILNRIHDLFASEPERGRKVKERVADKIAAALTSSPDWGSTTGTVEERKRRLRELVEDQDWGTAEDLIREAEK